MKRIFTNSTIIIVLLLLLVPPGLAAAQTPDETLDSSRINLIQSLYGKPITIGEFLQQVLPNEFEKLVTTIPQNRQQLLEEPFIWPKWPPDCQVNSRNDQPAIEALSEEDNETRDIRIIGLYWEEEDPISIGYGDIWHCGRSWTNWPPLAMTYLSAMSFVYYASDAINWSCVGFEYDYGYGVQSVIAVGVVPDSSEGWFFTHGVFQYICPPNCSLGDGTSQGTKYVTNDPVYLDPYNP